MQETGTKGDKYYEQFNLTKSENYYGGDRN